MAIQDDFTIDAANRRIVTTQTYINNLPPNLHTVNAWYTYIQDEVDEPSRMVDTVPISAQTSLQYRMENGWFVDDETVKSLLGGSLETLGWAKSGAEGITQVRWAAAPTSEPTAADIGKVVTGGTSGATGLLLAVDANKQIAWIRNTSATQFVVSDNITGPGSDPDFTVEATFGVASGESTWGNLFTVGSAQPETEIQVGQEDDYMAGTAQGGGGSQPVLGAITPWWDANVDFELQAPPHWRTGRWSSDRAWPGPQLHDWCEARRRVDHRQRPDRCWRCHPGRGRWREREPCGDHGRGDGP